MQAYINLTLLQCNGETWKAGLNYNDQNEVFVPVVHCFLLRFDGL